jgi:plasmid stabilization system protein ParE
MGKLRWTEKASTNLRAVFDYISRDSRVFAARSVKALVHATEKLQDMPRCGRIVPELGDPQFREVVFRNYRIVYRIVGANEDVEVLAVIHGARDLERAFREQWDLS